MKTINSETHIKLCKNNCLKGKHRFFQNRFGVTWCTICGVLSNAAVQADPDTRQPINPYEPLNVVVCHEN